MENSSIFATTNILKGGQTRLYAAGIFYALLQPIRGVTPVWSVNAPTALEVLVNGSVTPFLLLPQTSISEMTNTEKSCLPVNNSSPQATMPLSCEAGNHLLHVEVKASQLAAHALSNALKDLAALISQSLPQNAQQPNGGGTCVIIQTGEINAVGENCITVASGERQLAEAKRKIERLEALINDLKADNKCLQAILSNYPYSYSTQQNG
jgi:hypothetical protein